MGDNARGELGLGSVGGQQPGPVQISTLTNIVDGAGGGLHVVAVGSDGTVYGWGANGNGQIGNGSQADVTAPVPVIRRSTYLNGSPHR